MPNRVSISWDQNTPLDFKIRRFSRAVVRNAGWNCCSQATKTTAQVADGELQSVSKNVSKGDAKAAGEFHEVLRKLAAARMAHSRV
jgi:hypothetical protein